MKTRTIRAERKYFPSFDLKITPSAAVKFTILSLCIVLMASAGRFGYALALSFFCGLVYARQNIIALAPVFIIACCVFALDFWMILYTALPVILLVILYAIFSKLKKNVPLFAVALTAVFGMLPYAICTCLFYSSYLLVAASIALALVMTFCTGIVAYAIFVRGFLQKATVDELICSGILCVATGYALMGVGESGFRLLYVICALAVLVSSACLKSSVTLFTAILLGMGASLKGSNIALIAEMAVLGVAAIMFSPFTRWMSALACGAVGGIMWLLGCFEYGWQPFVMICAGLIVGLIVPRSFVLRIKSMSKEDDSHSYAGIVNRWGRELAARLYSTGDVFYEMSKNMDRLANIEDTFNSDRLAREVANSYCDKCPDKDGCFSALAGDTSGVIKPLADAAVNRGQATILDLPPFITSRCSRAHSLMAVINSTATSYVAKRRLAGEGKVGKSMLAEQFAGISLVLDSLASESSKQIVFAGDDIEYIKSELLHHNIVASEVVVSGKGHDICVTLLVRARDAQKAVLPKMIGKIFKMRFDVSCVESRGSQKLVYLESSPTYEVAYGIAESIRSGESVSGDSKSILCPSRTKRLFAICDGMGSGEGASQMSKDAVSMVESFYRAGFDNDIILGLVNKLLKLGMDEGFATLDIAVIDAVSGGLDIIKLGSASSFIVRKEGIESISCASPPAGILDGVKPLTQRFQLYDGDMLVMASDGVYDILEDRGVAEAVDTLKTVNPQTLADELLKRAKLGGAEDDCTVIVMRIFCT